MIAANELRIGNWVDGDGVFVQIDKSYFSYLLDYPITNRTNPIHLTPEILEKCGFEDIGNRDFKKDNWTFWGDGYLTTSQVKPILYLHQLQNLYFALTGEELNVDL